MTQTLGAIEGVLMSPQEYIRPMDKVNDARLLMLANERMSHYDPQKSISQEQLDQEFGYTSDDLADAEKMENE